MKPLVRWTVGPVSNQGIDSLCFSIENWNRVYGDVFDKFVCFNGIDLARLQSLDLDVQFVDQLDYIDSLIYFPQDTAWKFYPPRLRLNAHEIFIDNDLIVYERSNSVDSFLLSLDQFIVTSAHRRFYGSYKHMVPEHISLNSGLFGMPPNYDFKSDLNNFIRTYPLSGWLDHCDDEGVLAFLFSKKNLHMIPMKEIHVCNPDNDFAFYDEGSSGTHFVGLNNSRDKYWNIFRNRLS